MGVLKKTATARFEVHSDYALGNKVSKYLREVRTRGPGVRNTVFCRDKGTDYNIIVLGFT